MVRGGNFSDPFYVSWVASNAAIEIDSYNDFTQDEDLESVNELADFLDYSADQFEGDYGNGRDLLTLWEILAKDEEGEPHYVLRDQLPPHLRSYGSDLRNFCNLSDSGLDELKTFCVDVSKGFSRNSYPRGWLS